MKEKIGNVYDVRNMYSKEHLEALLNGPHGSRYRQNIAHVERLKARISHGQKEDVSSLDKLQDAERNADKVDADTDKKAAEVKEKEAAEATNAEDEWRQKELEEARIAADLQEQEHEGHLDADAAIREDD